MSAAWRVLLCAAVAAAQQPGHYVVELHDGGATAPALLQVFEGMGVSAAQATPLLARVAEKGRAVVIAGPEESCQAAGERVRSMAARRHPPPRHAAPHLASGRRVLPPPACPPARHARPEPAR
jgi:ATP-dependent Clp protease adapter protein ClpS